MECGARCLHAAFTSATEEEYQVKAARKQRAPHSKERLALNSSYISQNRKMSSRP
jgi:hypothetical protein